MRMRHRGRKQRATNCCLKHCLPDSMIMTISQDNFEKEIKISRNHSTPRFNFILRICSVDHFFS